MSNSQRRSDPPTLAFLEVRNKEALRNSKAFLSLGPSKILENERKHTKKGNRRKHNGVLQGAAPRGAHFFYLMFAVLRTLFSAGH